MSRSSSTEALRSPAFAASAGLRPFTWFAWIAIASLPAVFGAAPLTRAVELLTEPGFAPTFLNFGHGWLTHALVPVIGASACVLFLGPGLLATALVGVARTFEWWLVTSFVVSLVLVSALGAVWGPGGQGMAFGLAVLGLTALGYLALEFRHRAGVALPAELPTPSLRATAEFLAIPMALAALWAPKFLWESFNGDGAHAFESARLLLTQPVPFWPAASGEIAAFPGVTSFLFTYPVSWYLRLWGAHEASARLPVLLFLVLLYACIRGLSRLHTSESRPRSHDWLIWVAVAAYAWALAFNATYNPYVADIALPATQDTLSIVWFLAFVWAILDGRFGWAVTFGLLSHWCSPNGVLLLGIWFLSRAAVARPLPRRELGWTAAVGVLSMASSTLIPMALVTVGLPQPGSEYGLIGLLGRFAFLQVTDLGRLAFVALPCGLIPALYVVRWRGLDAVSRSLLLATVAYFAFFYFQAHISLHQFVPAMVLPAVVFWREHARRETHGWWTRPSLVLAGGALSIALMTPATLQVDVSGRRVGGRIEDLTEGYATSTPEAFRRASILQELFAVDWDPAVPEATYGGSALTWNHYAHRSRIDLEEPNYLLLSGEQTAPEGARLVVAAADAGAALYVRDDSVWANHRAMRPRTPAGSPLLDVPRGILFRTETLDGGPRVIAVLDVLAAVGVDTDAILERLGVERAP